MKVLGMSIQQLANKFQSIQFVGSPYLKDKDVIFFPKDSMLLVSINAAKYINSEKDNTDQALYMDMIRITCVIYDSIKDTEYVDLIPLEILKTLS